jgi:hypothetical protein
MKRLFVLTAAILIVAGVGVAQDLSGLGRDFEVIVEELGERVLPDVEQTAIWGQFPGIASYADRSGFFLTLSLGALLTDGVLGFVDEDPSPFTVLDVPGLLETRLVDAPTIVADLVNGMKGFLPIPVARTSLGFVLPGDVEAMVGVGGFPQLITGAIGGAVDAPSLRLNMLHLGTKVRRGILKDSGPFPAVSIGAGYAYSGFEVGYDLAALGESQTFGDTTYSVLPSTSLGDLYVTGDLGIRSDVHAFGLDVQASKALGFFVPYLGISPYYHVASFSGDVSGFKAFVDFDGANPDPDNPDIDYTGREPDASWDDHNLSFVVFGGFDMIFGGFVIQVGSSWSVAKGSPGVTLSTRWQ